MFILSLGCVDKLSLSLSDIVVMNQCERLVAEGVVVTECVIIFCIVNLEFLV